MQGLTRVEASVKYVIACSRWRGEGEDAEEASIKRRVVGSRPVTQLKRYAPSPAFPFLNSYHPSSSPALLGVGAIDEPREDSGASSASAAFASRVGKLS